MVEAHEKPFPLLCLLTKVNRSCMCKFLSSVFFCFGMWRTWKNKVEERLEGTNQPNTDGEPSVWGGGWKGLGVSGNNSTRKASM